LFASQLREKDKTIFWLHKEWDKLRGEIEKLNMQLNIEEKIKKLEAEKEKELLVQKIDFMKWDFEWEI